MATKNIEDLHTNIEDPKYKCGNEEYVQNKDLEIKFSFKKHSILQVLIIIGFLIITPFLINNFDIFSINLERLTILPALLILLILLIISFSRVFNRIKNSDDDISQIYKITYIDDQYNNNYKKDNRLYKFSNEYISEHNPEIERKKVNTKKIEENILTTMKNTYSNQIINEQKYREVENNFQEIRKRLFGAKKESTNKSILNLSVGAFSTIFAVGFLSSYVYFHDFSSFDIITFSIFFLPKATITIFIEIFSFFFLKLYRNNLEEIKYFQNELTNIEMKILALKTAMLMEDKESIKNIINTLKDTERNFVLQKDQTTISIEMQKNQSDTSLSEQFKTLSESFTNILSTLSPMKKNEQDKSSVL